MSRPIPTLANDSRQRLSLPPTMTNAEQERDRLRSLYAGMGDGELEKLAKEAAELTDLAREVLAEETRNRGLAVEQPRPVSPADSDEAYVVNRNGSRFASSVTYMTRCLLKGSLSPQVYKNEFSS